MNTYSYEDKLKQINIPDAEAIKQSDMVIMDFYRKLRGLEQISKKAGGKVVIAGDYDCDGICSSFIINKMFPDAVVCLGDRYKYGYGIPTNLPAGENDLVICTDIGTNDREMLRKINKTMKAMPVIIDHHEFEEEGMKSYRYLLNFCRNTDRDHRPDYCATGLAYKLYELDYRARHKIDEPAKWEKELNTVKALAAIGSIADMVKVNNPYDDNRRIILEGFEAMRNADFYKDKFDKTLGYILNECGITDNPYSITTDTIQMKVTPLFNSPSRMISDGAAMFYNALNAPFLNDRGQVIDETVNAINELFELNEQRKQTKTDALASEEYKAVKNNDAGIKVYINDDLPMGLNGLIASDLVSATGKPAVVFCKKPDGTYVGSGRNAKGYPSILETVKESGINAQKLGGHDDAFGLSVAPDKLVEVKAKLEEFYKSVQHKDVVLPYLDFVPKKGISCPITFDMMMQLEPFGLDFPKIRVEFEGKFSDHNIKLQDIKKENNPEEYKKFDVGGITYTTFSAGAELTEREVLDKSVHIGGELNIITYKDKKSYQVIFDDFLPDTDLIKREPKKDEAPAESIESFFDDIPVI